MGTCASCSASSVTISNAIKLCVDCLRKGVKPSADFHEKSRISFKLPSFKDLRSGVRCFTCGRRCSIPAGGRGYCGYLSTLGNSLKTSTGSPHEAVGLYYYDPHPTNCVAAHVCPATTGLGYPEYALSPSGEQGFYNIAVFYGGCSMDCLYCQNWDYRRMAHSASPRLSIDSLVKAVNSRTSCVCFFGGDPGPFAPHAILASKKMVERARSAGLRTLRVCWETNGLWTPLLLEEAVKLSLDTGGIVKVDFKAWSPEVYKALCDVEREHVDLIKRNISLIGKYVHKRRLPPLLTVSTLLVPGYLDDYEIELMTDYVAKMDTEIPYVFLGFRPDYMLLDLPTTSWGHAERAVRIAKKNGLTNVYVGNTFLLGHSY
ncbi:MAG: radical SAM protein [Desulfurococcaceae archaeon]